MRELLDNLHPGVEACTIDLVGPVHARQHDGVLPQPVVFAGRRLAALLVAQLVALVGLGVADLVRVRHEHGPVLVGRPARRRPQPRRRDDGVRQRVVVDARAAHGRRRAEPARDLDAGGPPRHNLDDVARPGVAAHVHEHVHVQVSDCIGYFLGRRRFAVYNNIAALLDASSFWRAVVGAERHQDNIPEFLLVEGAERGRQ